MNLSFAKPHIRRSTNQRNTKATLGQGKLVASSAGSAWVAGKNRARKPASSSIVSQGKISAAGSSESQSSQATACAQNAYGPPYTQKAPAATPSHGITVSARSLLANQST